MRTDKALTLTCCYPVPHEQGRLPQKQASTMRAIADSPILIFATYAVAQ
ncbi:hypothetical protein ACE1CD_10830 [Aerosakkonema sp. BLCC-F183]